MSIINKIKLTLFFNSLYVMGVFMFRLFLMIIVVIVIMNVFDGGINVKVNDKSYQFQIETEKAK